MKKNKMMRAASGLLIATLLTTSVIAGTFAKYTTSADGTDTARVAKWGVEIKSTGELFNTSYTKTDSNAASTITDSVVSSKSTGSDAEKVIAPGTSGSLTTTTISGTPEVAVRVTYTPTLTITGWQAKGKDDTSETSYFPIIFTVNGQTYGVDGMKDSKGSEPTNKSDSVSALKTAVENAIKAYSKDYAANTDLSKINENSGNGYVAVSWEWAFDKNDDVKDTYLGDSKSDNKISLKIETTVTQID